MRLDWLVNKIVNRIDRNDRVREIKDKEKMVAREKWEEQASEYLLPISAKSYTDSVGKNLSNFTQKDIFAAHIWGSNSEEAIFKCKKDLIKKGQKLGAEKVVGVKPPISNYQPDNQLVCMGGIYTLYNQPTCIEGTALVPKK